MFEQHPVPQNIASYQFRLVGDMTLTQFFQLAGGALVGLLIYSLPLPNIFKWPLIAICVLGGAAMAFLPIQERPLAMWLGAFMRSIYSPTVYIWQKLPSYQFFASEDQTGVQVASQPEPSQQPQIDPANPAHVVNLEEGEKTMLNKISRLFTIGGGIKTAKTQTTQVHDVIAPQTAQTAPILQPAEPPKEIVIPQKQAVTVEKQDVPDGNDFNHTPIEVTEQKLNQTLSPNQMQNTVGANFSVNAAPPTPERPNVIVGQVMDREGKIIGDAILEIKDEQGRPVRALKTNKAGHFLIVTPLNNGKYTISVEKEGYNFDTIEVEARGEIIEPIAIQAK